MNNMSFNVLCVRQCLLDFGKVYTVRTWKGIPEGEDIVMVPGVGKCTKTYWKKVSCIEDIERYVEFSGFPDAKAWFSKIQEFHACPGYMFLVRRVTPLSPLKYQEIHGDIFTSNAQILVNTINCVGAMGRGIALAFKIKYPNMYQEYRKACFRHEIRPGMVWVYHAADGKIIFNAAVKDDWRNPSRIEWVSQCLQEIIRIARELKVTSVAIPWMGAMNGRIPVTSVKAETRKALQGITDIAFSVYEIRKLEV